MNLVLEMIVEVEKGSRLKYEYEYETEKMKLDRIISIPIPVNYGTLWEGKKPESLYYDGDAIDIMCWSDLLSFHSGTVVPVQIIGVMKMNDNGQWDDKLLGIHGNDPVFQHIKNIDDLKTIIPVVESFFKNYKSGVKIEGWGDVNDAKKVLEKSRELYWKYKDKMADKKELANLLLEEQRKDNGWR